MSTVRAEDFSCDPAHRHIVSRTVEACRLAKEAAGAAAEAIATGSITLLNSLRQRERELDDFRRGNRHCGDHYNYTGRTC